MSIPIIAGPYKTFRRLNPGETFVEYEGSTITIPITARFENNGQVVRTETREISLKAFMRLEVMPAYVNGLGTREFQFVIRDWDLFGFSELLNELFYRDPLGRPRGPVKPDDPNQRQRQIAVMTFSLAHHYFKYGDDDNVNLGRADDLVIENITSHDLVENNLYWEIIEEKARAGNEDQVVQKIVFYNKSPAGRDIASLDLKKADLSELRFLLAEGAVTPGRPFTATLSEERYRGFNITPARGNATISKLIRPVQPLRIHWRFGTAPKTGAKGRIRVVSPAKSICTAHQRPDLGRPIDSTDFPARIMYAASYNIFINNQRFVEDQAGIAIADGVDQIPPRDVTVAFAKPHIGRVLGRYLEFGPGHCTGMHEITEAEYRQGVETARFWQAQPLEPVV